MPQRITNVDFSQVMDIYGQTLNYYPGRLCSCVRENNGTPKKSCGCNIGFWYDTPETIHGIRQQVSWKYLNTPQGRIFDGGAQFTIPKNYEGTEQVAWTKIAHGDIISVVGKFRRDTDILIKGVRDYLFAFDIVDVLTVSRENKVYVKDTDYQVSGNQITWIGDAPLKDEYYSVEFTCTQQFKVWEAGAQDRGTDGDELPRKILTVIRRYVDVDNANVLDDYNYSQSIFG